MVTISVDYIVVQLQPMQKHMVYVNQYAYYTVCKTLIPQQFQWFACMYGYLASWH